MGRGCAVRNPQEADGVRKLLQDARRADRAGCRRTAWRTTPRSSPCRVATSWSRRGTRSVVDFTDTANPVEIAFFDRGPTDVPNPGALNLGGLWSTYWYNGYIYGSEIARGFDTFGPLPSEFLSEDEVAAASQVEQDQFNAQPQLRLAWKPSFEVVGSHFDQAVRSGALSGRALDRVEDAIQDAERLAGAGSDRAAAKELRTGSRHLRGSGDQGELRPAMHDLARALR